MGIEFHYFHMAFLFISSPAKSSYAYSDSLTESTHIFLEREKAIEIYPSFIEAFFRLFNTEIIFPCLLNTMDERHHYYHSN